MRNHFGDVIYLMTHIPPVKGPTRPLLTYELVRALLNVQRLESLMRKKENAASKGLLTTDDHLIYAPVSTESPGTSSSNDPQPPPRTSLRVGGSSLGSNLRTSGSFAPRPMAHAVAMEVMQLERSNDTKDMLEDLFQSGFIMQEEYHARMAQLQSDS